MARLLIIATANQHKVDEIGAILSPATTCIPMRTLGDCPELIEDGNTFEANASKKVTQLAQWIKRTGEFRFPVERFSQIHLLADDSGLEVDALDGAPGVRSARFAATDDHPGNASDPANNRKLLALLSKTPDTERTARFRCVLALARSSQLEEPDIHLFSGHCEGRIATELHGNDGFGYDPLFFPDGYDRSFGELGSAIKNRISHRAQALEKLAAFLHAPA